MFEEELLELLKEFYETEKFEFTESTKDCISEVLIYKTDHGYVGIKKRSAYYSIFKVRPYKDNYMYYYNVDLCRLSFKNGYTILKKLTEDWSEIEKKVIKGKKFDLDKMFVIAKLGG